MKNLKTIHTTMPIILFLFFFFFSACSDTESINPELGFGTVTFTKQTKEKESIRLVNARTQSHVEQTHFLDIYQNGVAVHEDIDFAKTNTLELEAGDYTATLEVLDYHAKPEGRVMMDGDVAFTIAADQTNKVEFLMFSYWIELNISVAMPGAKVAYGEKGFEPEASDFQVAPISEQIYPDWPEIDIVVSFEGETKRYTAAIDVNHNYNIQITKKDEPEEPAETGKVEFSYLGLEKNYKSIGFEW